MTDWTGLGISLLKAFLVFFGVVNTVPILVWAERRGSAFMQDRPGPNRLGPLGLFQGLADAVKFLFKEDVTPAAADKPLYLMAPALALLPAFTTSVVIPWGPDFTWDGQKYRFVVANADTGVLLFLALASLGVYSLVMAGYASNNKFSTTQTVTVKVTQPPPPVVDPPVIHLNTPDYIETLYRDIYLDASGSTDPQGLPLTYKWEQVGQVNNNSAAAILSSGSPATRVQLGGQFGDYIFRVTVTNSKGVSASKDIRVRFVLTRRP